MQRFRKSFRQLPDPRAGNARHDLLEALFVALAAVVCGSVRIPIHAGHLFRDEAGHHSDLIPATVPR